MRRAIAVLAMVALSVLPLLAGEEREDKRLESAGKVLGKIMNVPETALRDESEWREFHSHQQGEDWRQRHRCRRASGPRHSRVLDALNKQSPKNMSDPKNR